MIHPSWNRQNGETAGDRMGCRPVQQIRSQHADPTQPSNRIFPNEVFLNVAMWGQLGVLFGEVVPGEAGEGAGRGVPGECAVGSMVIVEVDEPVVAVVALGF